MFTTFDRAGPVMDSLPLSLGHRSVAVDGGQKFEHTYRVPFATQDGQIKWRTFDSSGAFLIGELERLDPTLYEPLAEVSWGRDIDLREDVSIADEVSSFTLTTYGSAGGLGTGNAIGNGKAWAGKETSQVTGVSLDIGKFVHPLRVWAMEVKYTILELESAAKVGRPVDQQKFEGLQLKHQMDIDEQVYYGDTYYGDTGLVNCSDVTAVANYPNGVSGSPLWPQKTPSEILSDVNSSLTTAWNNSGWAVLPDSMLIPPNNYGYIATQLVSLAGNTSILSYVLDNNLIAKGQIPGNGKKLRLLPAKWCNGAGAGGTIGNASTTSRTVTYSKDRKRVRYPMTPMQRTPVQFSGMYHMATYFCRLGVVEAVYPATLDYMDGA